MRAAADPVTAYARSVVAGQVIASRLVKQACARHLRDLEEQSARGLEWRPEKARMAIEFFADVLFLPERTDAADIVEAREEPAAPEPFVLKPWEEFIVGSLFGWWMVNGSRRFREAYIETAKGSGKALDVTTPIPTPDGWTTMGAIQVGDRVFDERGRAVNVVGAYDVMTGHDCYEVVFDDGSSIVADAEHLWWTEQRRSANSPDGRSVMRGVPRSERGRWRTGVRTTEEIRRSLTYSNGQYQSANHSIPLAGPLGIDAKPLPINPYVLGVWLGDGDSDCARITVDDADAELIEHVAACGVAVGERKQSRMRPRTPRYRIGGTGGRGTGAPNSLNAVLRRMGMFNRPKHIPPDYLRASVDQRLALLQGLMDTDGYIDKSSGQCEFSVTNKALAEGVRELVVSLGIKTNLRERSAKLYGREVSRCWRIAFHPPADLPVFRLRRKLQHQTVRHNRRRLSGDRRIVDVRAVPSVPVRCIAVDSPSYLFLAGESMVPTHNTPLGAGIMLYLLVADGQRGAQVFLAAVTREQAGIAWRDVEAMVEASPELVALFGTGKRANQLLLEQDSSFLKPVSSEKRGLDGKRVHGALIDELHEHATPVVVNKMRAGTKGQRNALIVKTTNSGFDRTSVCWHHHEHSRQVLDGTVTNEAWFAFICGLDPCEEHASKGHWFPTDECAACDSWKVEGPHWLKANPNLGVSLPWQYVRERVAQALAMTSEVSDVLRFNFCVWTQAVSRAIDMGRWKVCKDMPSDEELAGADCFGCLDLGETDDFTAEGRLWCLDDGRVAVKMRFWVPEVALTKYPNRPYDEWQRLGLLNVTPGEVTDYATVRAQILEDSRQDGIRQWFYDQRTARETAQLLIAEGLDMVPMLQGFALNEAIKRLLGLITSGDLCHGNDPILTWMASNLVLLTGAKGERRVAKERAPEKIDGIAALVMGIEGAIIRRERIPEPQFQMVFLGGRA